MASVPAEFPLRFLLQEDGESPSCFSEVCNPCPTAMAFDLDVRIRR